MINLRGMQTFSSDKVFLKFSVDKTMVKEGGKLIYTIKIVDEDGNLVPVPASENIVINLSWKGTAIPQDIIGKLPSNVIISGSSGTSFEVQIKKDGLQENIETIESNIIKVVDKTELFENIIVDEVNSKITSTIIDSTVEKLAITLSEEGLFGGNKDNIGISDTTDNTIVSGVLSKNSNNVKYELSYINDDTGLTSDGVKVLWTKVSSNLVIAKANGIDILKVSIDNDGKYNVELLKAVDHKVNNIEDVVKTSLNVDIIQAGVKSTTSIEIKIEDDMPKSTELYEKTKLLGNNTNIMFTLDLSKSMDESTKICDKDGYSKTKLQLAKESITKIIDTYDNYGNVKINLVVFGNTAKNITNGWVSISEMKVILDTLCTGEVGNATNYDAALSEVINSFNNRTNEKLANGTNISYFLSDGDPTLGDGRWGSLENSQGNYYNYYDRRIDYKEENIWKKFLIDNNVKSIALGMGEDISKNQLNKIAYDGIDNINTKGVVVKNLDTLESQIANTISIKPIKGELKTLYGADDGFISKIELNSTIYNFDIKNNQIINIKTGEIIKGTIFTYHTSSNSSIEIDMSNGKYIYIPNKKIASANDSEEFLIKYTLTDKDNDSNVSTLKLHFGKENNLGITDQITSVSEEGLLNGNKDNTGIADTTNKANSIGKMDIIDADKVIFTSNQPTLIGGTKVFWIGENTNNLIANDLNGNKILTVNINNKGEYKVILNNAISHNNASIEDVESLKLNIKASNSGLEKSGTLTINIEDDSPIAINNSVEVETNLNKTNLMITLDVSGSMNNYNAFEKVKESTIELIKTYASNGATKVWLTLYSDWSRSCAYPEFEWGTSTYVYGSDNSKNGMWVDVSNKSNLSKMINFIEHIQADGGTDTQASIKEMEFGVSSKGMIPNGEKIAYVITDGDPTTRLGNWEQFAKDNQVNVKAFGFANVNNNNLNKIAYNGIENINTNGIKVKNIDEFKQTILDDIQVSVYKTNLLDKVGADGASLVEFDIDGNKFYNNGSKESSLNAIWDNLTKTWSINTSNDSKIVLNMVSAEFSYSGKSSLVTKSEEIKYKVVDSDGDSVISSLTLNQKAHMVLGKEYDVHNVTDYPCYNNDVKVQEISCSNENDTIRIRNNISSSTKLDMQDGDDKIIIDGYMGSNSKIYLGEGNDSATIKNEYKLLSSYHSNAIIDGGNGYDKLSLTDSYDGVDLSKIAYNTKNIEELDFTSKTSNCINISLQDVIDISDNNNKLVIKGDYNDYVKLNSYEWVNSSSNENLEGTSYKVYNGYYNSSVKLLIEDNMEVY